MESANSEGAKNPPVVFILSGGAGTSAVQLLNTVLAQFPDSKVTAYTIGSIRHPEQIDRVVAQAQQDGGLILHTFVEDQLRQYLEETARAKGVQSLDLMGPLIGWLSEALGQKPMQQPGRYRQLHREYYDRVAALEYTLDHDDGKSPEGWPGADVMLVGVSRSGKTPLAVYLAILGWKVANYPVVPDLPVPPALFALDPTRVIGLTIDPEQLLVYRRQRQARLGVREASAYTELDAIRDELRQAKRVFREGGFEIMNVTDKTIEQTADEIIRKMTSHPTASPFA